MDTAVSGRELVVDLLVRRFFCDADGCGRRTFAEQIPGLTFRHGRCAAQLRRVREAVAVALGGRPGARMTGRLAIGVGRDALLRLVRALPDPDPCVVRVLGVDDFALRRGHRYGTLLVDMETRRVVDMLPERSADAFAAWLDAHPGVEVVCRDRAGCYSEGAARGAPLAVQVADRFHLWANLGTAVERAVTRLRPHWTPPAEAPPVPRVPDPADRPDTPREQLVRERHAAVHDLVALGMPVQDIAARLRLDRKTVRKYRDAALADTVVRRTRPDLRRLLDDDATFLARRRAEGCINAPRLQAELRERGTTVGTRTIRRFLASLRRDEEPAAKPKTPRIREVATLLMTRPGTLRPDDQVLLKELRTRCPDLDDLARRVRAFAEMLVHRRGRDDLEPWTSEAQNSSHPELRSYAAGLRKDWNAVMAGLTLQWSSGTVEGHVNRVQKIKRDGFGRANPDLLRKRVLLDR